MLEDDKADRRIELFSFFRGVEKRPLESLLLGVNEGGVKNSSSESFAAGSGDGAHGEENRRIANGHRIYDRGDLSSVIHYEYLALVHELISNLGSIVERRERQVLRLDVKGFEQTEAHTLVLRTLGDVDSRICHLSQVFFSEGIEIEGHEGSRTAGRPIGSKSQRLSLCGNQPTCVNVLFRHIPFKGGQRIGGVLEEAKAIGGEEGEAGEDAPMILFICLAFQSSSRHGREARTYLASPASNVLS